MKENKGVSLGRGDTDCGQAAIAVGYIPPKMTEAQEEAISKPYPELFIEFYKLPWHLKSTAQSKFIKCYSVIRTDDILNMYISLIDAIAEGYQPDPKGYMCMDLHRELDNLIYMFADRFIKKFPEQSYKICGDIFKESLKKSTRRI